METLEKHDNYMMFFDSIYRIFLYIRFNNVQLSRHGDIRKNDERNLVQTCNNDSKLFEYIINFLEKHKYIKKEKNLLQSNVSYRMFLKQHIHQQLDFIISSDELLKEIFILLQDICFSTFSYADVQKEYFNKYLNEHCKIPDNELLLQIKERIDIMHWLGLICSYFDEKTNTKVFHYTNFLDELRGLKKYQQNKKVLKKSLVVDNNYQITCNPEYMESYDLLIISVFCRLIKKDKVYIFNFDKKTVQDAVYTGYELNLFIEAIERNCDNSIDKTIMFNLDDWNKNLKQVKMQKIIVINGQSELMDVIEMSNKINMELERIGTDYLKIKGDKLVNSFIQNENIYILKEGIDF